MRAANLAPIGPRTITRFRRVTLPRTIRDAAGCHPGVTVEVGVIDRRRRLIGVRAMRLESANRQRGVLRHARQVTEVGQVSIPQAVLAKVDVEALANVYFIQPTRPTGMVWIVPAEGLGALMRTDLSRLDGIDTFLGEQL
ncbi:hypothetical protein ACIBG5_10695 [Kribbella sp. NPDC050241]|uniref:hypothetical protein n=1 Tax=Kribbella sp. NPDC050241 TaxID=3364115 RepID=UPI0037906BD5